MFPKSKNSFYGELTEGEVEFEKGTLYENLVSTVNLLAHYTKDRLNPKKLALVQTIKKNDMLSDYSMYTPEIADAMTEIASIPAISEEYKERKYDLPRGVEYLLQHVPRYKQPLKLKLSHQDILHTYTRDVGWSPEKDQRSIRAPNEIIITKIAGQKSERHNVWHLKDSNLLIFMINLTDYCQDLFEDTNVGRHDDSFIFLEEILNNSLFSKVPIFVMFNMRDVLPEFIKQYRKFRPAEVYLKKYQFLQEDDEITFDLCLKYMIWKFSHSIRRSQVYFHLLNATDPQDIKDIVICAQNCMHNDHFAPCKCRLSLEIGNHIPFGNPHSSFSDILIFTELQ